MKNEPITDVCPYCGSTITLWDGGHLATLVEFQSTMLEVVMDIRHTLPTAYCQLWSIQRSIEEWLRIQTTTTIIVQEGETNADPTSYPALEDASVREARDGSASGDNDDPDQARSAVRSA